MHRSKNQRNTVNQIVNKCNRNYQTVVQNLPTYHLKLCRTEDLEDLRHFKKIR